MKQRLSKLALLAVAAALIVAGFPACSDEEEPEPPAQATAAFTGEGIPESGLALTAGEPKDDVTATLTVANTAFSDAVKNLDEGDAIPDTLLTLSAGEKVSVDAKLTEKVEGNTMKITLTVTADADAAADGGTISATLKAAALMAAKDVEATGTISYTVEAADPDAPKATFEGDNIPTEGVSLAVGEEKTGDATITVTNTTFSDEVKALNEGDTIPDTLLTLNAGDKVTVTSVKVAAKANDTTVKITLAVTAGESTGTGAIKATLKAAALTTENDVTASGNIAYTVKDASKPDETVYFTSFVASELGATGKTGPFTSADGLVTIGARSTYQVTTSTNDYNYSTADYDKDAGSGYTYTARVKINTTQKTNMGTLTIKPVKVGDVLRFDGGNANKDNREMKITGADETVWKASAQGSFYLTATAETVVLESMTNEFCIYGIHVVDKKVEESVVSEVTTYEKPTLSLSAESVVKGEEVTVTATIPAATKTTTYSTGKVESEKVPVDAAISYDGATVTDGKVGTSAEGTLTITASYTIGEATYTSEAVTLKVTKAFESQTKNVENNEATLGLIASGEATSTNPAVATAEINGDNIVITSKEKGEATITVGDGTNTARIVVTVEPDGEIGYKVYKYAVIYTITWAVPDKDSLSGVSTLAGLEVGSVEGYASNEKVAWTNTSSKFLYEGESKITVATFTTNLKTAGSDCISNGSYAQVVITNNTSKDITLSELEYTHSISDKNSGYGCQAFYWIGEVTGAGTTLATSAYGTTSAILTKAKVAFAEDTVVVAGQSVTIRFAYYGGNNGSKVCALKDVVLSVK